MKAGQIMNTYNMSMTVPSQPDNPSNVERYALIRYALALEGRPEDFGNIVNLLSPAKDITTIGRPGEFKNIKVGIIGGGLAGLASAYELRKLGFDITVFEAHEERIGGRVYTYYFNGEKTLYGELGPMRIPVTHETVWHYINLFKLNTRPFIQVNNNALIYLHNIRVKNDPLGLNVMKYIYPYYSLYPWERTIPWHKLAYYGLNSHMLRSAASVRSEILKILPIYSNKILCWDETNIRQTLEECKVSNAAINLITSLVPLAGQFLYNSYIDFIQENYPVDFSYLYEIIGGLANLPLALYNSITNKTPEFYPGIPYHLLGKVTWKGGSRVTCINKYNNKIILTYKNKAFPEEIQESFDYVICAIPFSTLRTVKIDPLFSNIKMQAIQEVTYVPAQKTIFLCDRRFWEDGGTSKEILGGGTYTDLPINTIWYPSDHAKYSRKTDYYTPMPAKEMKENNSSYAKKPGVLLASYNLNQNAIRLGNMPEEICFEETKREVEEVHGLSKASLDAIVAAHKTQQWNTDPSFRGAFCFFTPEQKRIFSYPMTLPEYNGHIFFAGEHISPTHRWMQGALKTGMEAANSLAAACKSGMGGY